MCDIYIKSIMLYFCVLNHRKKEDKQGTWYHFWELGNFLFLP